MALLTGFLLALLLSITGVAPIATRSPLPLLTMPIPAVQQRIGLAVDSNCGDGLAAAKKDWGPSDWASLAHFVMSCGDRQHGLTQARIYAYAASITIESILWLMPDAYGSEYWRRTGRRLISEALPNATKDRELVELLNSMRSKLATSPREVDLKPNQNSVAPQELAPAGTSQIESRYADSVKLTYIWFFLHSGLSDAQDEALAHLRELGWYICPPEHLSGPHDEIESPQGQRIADRHFYASLRNEWDITALLYAQQNGATKVEYRVSKVDMAPLCSPHRS